ncbi:MFS transporter [Spirochaetia bacterium]|nr:MFS transporter [Spirochaetia bacterium]
MKMEIVVPALAASILINSFMAVVPILAEIQKSFPEAAVSGIQLLYTISSLFSLVTMLLAGRLVYYFSKKTLLLVGIGIMFAGGVLPFLFHQSLWMLYILCAVFGIGMGFNAVISSTLISDHFKGIEKGRIMGIQAAIVSIGGAVMSALTGFIAAHANWALSYLVFVICIPIFILVLFILPKDKITLKTEAKGGGINGRLVCFVTLNFFISMCINVFNSNNAMFLEKTGLGNAAVAGTVQFIFMIVGIPVGLKFGSCIKFLGRNIMGIAALFVTLGMFLTAFSHSLITVYIGSLLIGAGFAIKCPGGITFSSNMVHENSAAMAIALNNAFGSVGSFISPIFFNTITEKIGGKLEIQFIISGAISLLLALLYFLIGSIKKEEVKAH